MEQNVKGIGDLIKLYQPTHLIKKKLSKEKKGMRRYLKKAYPLQYGPDGKTLINHGPWMQEEKETYLKVCEQFKETCSKNIKSEMKEVYKEMLQKIPTRNLTQIKGFHIKKNPYPGINIVKEKKRFRRTKEEMKKHKEIYFKNKKKCQERELRKVEKLAKTNNEILTSQTQTIVFCYGNGISQKIKAFCNNELLLSQVYLQILNQNSDEIKTEKIEFTDYDSKLSELMSRENNLKFITVQEKVQCEKVEEDDLGRLDQAQIISVSEMIQHIEKYFEQVQNTKQKQTQFQNDYIFNQSFNSPSRWPIKKISQQNKIQRRTQSLQPKEIIISDDSEPAVARKEPEIGKNKNVKVLIQHNQKITNQNENPQIIEKNQINQQKNQKQKEVNIDESLLAELKSEDEIYASDPVSNQVEQKIVTQPKLIEPEKNQQTQTDQEQKSLQNLSDQQEKQFQEISQYCFGVRTSTQVDTNQEIDRAMRVIKLEAERKEKEALAHQEKQKQAHIDQEKKKHLEEHGLSQIQDNIYYQRIHSNLKEQKRLKELSQMEKIIAPILPENKQVINTNQEKQDQLNEVKPSQDQNQKQMKKVDQKNEKSQGKQMQISEKQNSASIQKIQDQIFLEENNSLQQSRQNSQKDQIQDSKKEEKKQSQNKFQKYVPNTLSNPEPKYVEIQKPQPQEENNLQEQVNKSIVQKEQTNAQKNLKLPKQKNNNKSSGQNKNEVKSKEQQQEEDQQKATKQKKNQNQTAKQQNQQVNQVNQQQNQTIQQQQQQQQQLSQQEQYLQLYQMSAAQQSQRQINPLNPYQQQQMPPVMQPKDLEAMQKQNYVYPSYMLDPTWQQYYMQNYMAQKQNQEAFIENEYSRQLDQINNNQFQESFINQPSQDIKDIAPYQPLHPTIYPSQPLMNNQFGTRQFYPYPAMPNQSYPYQLPPQIQQNQQPNDPSNQYQVEMMYIYHEVPQNFDPNLFFQYSPQSFVPLPGGNILQK